MGLHSSTTKDYSGGFHVVNPALRSGQVTVFNVHIQSKLLQRTPVRGTACTGRYKGIRAVRPESLAGGGWFELLWNLECPVGLSQKRNMCAFQ